MQAKALKTEKVRTKRIRPKDPWKKSELKALIGEIEALRSTLRDLGDDAIRAIEAADPDCRASTRNLLQGLAFRSHLTSRPTDIQSLNHRLSALGLAYLGPRDSHLLAAVDAIRATLHRLRGQTPPEPSTNVVNAGDGERFLKRRCKALLGPAAEPGPPRIFAKLPKDDTEAPPREASADQQPVGVTKTPAPTAAPNLISELIGVGTSGFYLDATRGTPEAWSRLSEAVRRDADARERPQRLLVGLGGPVIETGELAQGSAVVRFEPRRNQLGKLLSPARLWLTAEDRSEAPLQPVDVILPVSTKLLHEIQTEDTVCFKDARGRRRALKIRGAGRSGCLAETDQTTYLEAGAALHLERRGKLIAKGHVGALPRLVRPLELSPGNPLILTRELVPGRPALSDGGFLRSPAQISCTAPEILKQVKAGERVIFGAGELVGIVESVTDEGLRIIIIEARNGRHRRRPYADKGSTTLVSGVSIRFPDSSLDAAAFGPGDDGAVIFAARHADAVVLHGVERPEDVLALGDALDAQGGPQIAILLGIETRRGVDALPRLLLAALRRPQSGVLISPGALALDYGPARLDAVLADVLWHTRSAHLPLISASAVLDRLTRRQMVHPTELRNAVSGVPADGLLIGDGQSLLEILTRLRGSIGRPLDIRSRRQSSSLGLGYPGS